MNWNAAEIAARASVLQRIVLRDLGNAGRQRATCSARTFLTRSEGRRPPLVEWRHVDGYGSNKTWALTPLGRQVLALLPPADAEEAARLATIAERISERDNRPKRKPGPPKGYWQTRKEQDENK